MSYLECCSVIFPYILSLARTIDFVSLAMESQIPLFFSDLDTNRKALLEGSVNQPNPDIPSEDIFALYRRTKTLLEMYKAFCPS